MDKVILHSDLNNFYASVECLYRPDIRQKPVAVCGDVQKRHGIILAKNMLAKRYGIKTGEPVWQAQNKCPGIVLVPPNFERYLQYSKMAREIYAGYSSQVESFGLDECWLDISQAGKSAQDGVITAQKISRQIKSELGVTVSIGVSFNKIFAKLGSDYKKPDAITSITSSNYKQMVWPLPVSDLLYAGPATTKKLAKYGIHTIGECAGANTSFLKSILGINGIMLWQFANGLDTTPVRHTGESAAIKSIGNSTTMPYDVSNLEDVKIILYILAESVSKRLRSHGFLCGTIQLGIRDNTLFSYERQAPLPFLSDSAQMLAHIGLSIYQKHHSAPLRSLSLRACNLADAHNRQLSLLDEFAQMQKHERAEAAIEDIRRRFGHFSIQRGIMLQNNTLSCLNPSEEHVIHPVAFLR